MSLIRTNAVRLALALSCGALATDAQQPAPPVNLADQPALQTLSAGVRGLRRTATVADPVKAEVDKLLTEAGSMQASGQAPEARRRMIKAWSLLNGKEWDPKQEFGGSLVLRADRIIADSSLPFMARLSQIYSANYRPQGGLRVKASLLSSGPARDLGTFPVPARDLIEQPFGFEADLEHVTDGAYKLHAEVLDGETLLATLEQSVQIVDGIESQRAVVDRRLAKVQGHEGTKGSVRYPFQLARTVNSGRRLFSTADFGIPWDPKQPPYDFAAGMKNSLSLLKSLEAGKDPLLRAKGDHQRHYWLEEAGEPMPYRVYAPLKWDGKSKLPMVLVLHGNTRDHDYYFDRDEGILAKQAEQHGFLVVTPMGYRPSAGWGSNLLRPPAGAGGRGGGNADPARLRQSELSEIDAIHVLDMVTKEYPVDPARVYLFGHSAGGAGTWYIGQKYPERFAAIAASAAATRPEGFPFERLKGMPVMVCHGDKDDEVPVASSRNMVKAMKEHGNEPIYLEVAGATHGTIVALVEPKVFDFFDQHARKQ